MHTLLMAFDTDEPEFARGFEIGGLWAALSLAPDSHSVLLHATNETMARRCAVAKNYTVQITPLDDCWIEAKFEIKEMAEKTPEAELIV